MDLKNVKYARLIMGIMIFVIAGLTALKSFNPQWAVAIDGILGILITIKSLFPSQDVPSGTIDTIGLGK